MGMTVTRPQFTSPVLILDEFLSEDKAAACLRECIDLRPVYMPASVGNGPNNRRDAKFRRNDVVMLNTVFRVEPSRSVLLTEVKARIAECRALWHEGDLIFDVVNYANWHESVLSRYGTCDFYARHQDTVRNPAVPTEITHRLVTLVYYLNREPEAFLGGKLTLYKGGQALELEPRHNRAIVFPSFTFHEVGKVKLHDEGDWAGSRFSLNHWMGFDIVKGKSVSSDATAV